MSHTVAAFDGKCSVAEYYEYTRESILRELYAMSDDILLGNDEQSLADDFIEKFSLSPIQEDPNRSRSATEKKVVGGDPTLNSGRTFIEVRHTIIEVPLLPRRSNSRVVQLHASSWPMDKIEAEFNLVNHVLTITTFSAEVEQKLKLLKTMMAYVNRDIELQNPNLLQYVWDALRRRRREAAQANRQFVEKMEKLGIPIGRRPGAIEPIALEVRQEIVLLREEGPNADPMQPHLAPKNLAEIIGLIDKSGKNFEATPEVYSKLQEEQLRDIIVGNLNSVFLYTVAAGEVFSKGGKCDILINAPGGVALIAECKKWGGQALYNETISQLFGYMAFHHTIGIMITFSTRKGLTNAISEAKRAIREHPSFLTGSLVDKTTTYCISTHEHPDDPLKRIEVHHLFFNLYSSAT